jgi:hypothetical protein
MTTAAMPGKRIAPGAYEALVEALALVFWNKDPLERTYGSRLIAMA